MPAKVFVSYSRKDQEWCRIFQDAMGGGVYAETFEFFVDKDGIRPGEEWAEEISGAIGNSRAALLLVANGFLASNFISKTELPTIFRYRDAGRLRVLWVPIDNIPALLLEKMRLAGIHSAWPLNDPLSDFKDNKKRLNDALLRIADSLTKAVDLDDSSDEIRPKVENLVARNSVVLGESFAAGDYSMFYRARQADAEVAVKALIPAPNKAWLNADFVKRANTVRNISKATAISIRHVIPDPHIPCVVMDFLTAPTLQSRLEKDGKLSGQLVADVLSQLVRLADALHKVEGEPLIGPVRPSHVHYDSAKGEAHISLLPIANETLESCRNHPTRLQDSRALTYLSPERYYGKALNEKVDQYYLALLALELLQGKPPISIDTFSDLQAKVRFFESPRSYFVDEFRQSQPALSFVLARMLEFEPDDRWASLEDLARALEDIAVGKVPEAVRQHADNQYGVTLQTNADFYRAFYRILIESSDDIRVLFQNSRMEEQSRKLDDAMQRILNFRAYMSTSSIGGEVKRHRGMNIKAEHFGLFRDAFVKALKEAQIVDGYSEDAWQAVLHPALDYMRAKISNKPA